MRILLTGASGYLGSRILNQLLEHTGHEIAALVRPGRERALPRHARVVPVAGDITDPTSLRLALKSCRAAVHAAAKVSTWARDPAEFDRVNVKGAFNVLRAAGEAGLDKVLYVSSFLALGSSAGTPLDEDSPHLRQSHFNDYERTKYAANIQAQELAQAGLPLVTLYPAVIYGPGPFTAGNLISNLVRDHLRGRLPARIGHGRQRWNFVYVEDVAAGVRLALERGKPGRNYILGGENVSLGQFFAALATASGQPAPRLAVPFWAARLIGWAEERLATLSGRMPQLTRGVVDIFRRDWEFDSSRAVHELGYSARPLSEGLELTVRWLRESIPDLEGQSGRKAAP
ncbi:NAD-dependent epimerase/dehydratase family protein [bacterium]|nr:NAD-dependent epimerase/dehydratase family protein [bacterium]